jgi:hypothetical protein
VIIHPETKKIIPIPNGCIEVHITANKANPSSLISERSKYSGERGDGGMGLFPKNSPFSLAVVNHRFMTNYCKKGNALNVVTIL